MMRNLVLVLLAVLLLAACGNEEAGTPKGAPSSEANPKEMDVNMNTSQDERFAAYVGQFLERYWEHYPASALYRGYYKYDDQLTIPDEAREKGLIAFYETARSELDGFDTASLSQSNQTDLAILKTRMERALFHLQTFRSGEWDPTQYNVAGSFGLILNTDYKPLDDRLRVILRRLENVPAYYEAAKANIDQPTLEHTTLAINQSKGGLGVFEQRLPELVEQSGLSNQEKVEFNQRLVAAAEAIKAYASWLEALLPALRDGEARSFRIGEALYEQKFALEIVSDKTGRELYELALKDKERLHTEMIRLSKELWAKYFPGTEFPMDELAGVKQMIDRLAERHIGRDEFVDEVRRQMPIINQFIIDNDLVEMDPTRPLVVRETPEYQRGYAGASVNSPGPYDAKANTYYNVTPLDHYTEEQAESYLREYNHWTLQILNIHEALPGHYTQLVHANKSPSLVKSLFGNGAMIEGWAVYSERMMLENGYGDNEPELWLMYAKWNLRVVVNTIIDYEIQVLGKSREEVMDMLTREAFQEMTEASGKWNRATTSQVQLTSYYSGYSEIYAFRQLLMDRMGEDFDLKTFHDKFLSYGSAPVPVIKQLMLAELEEG